MLSQTTSAPSPGSEAPLKTDEGRAWLLPTVVMAAVALLKGARMPNTWAATAALIDYRHGLIKRGLEIGEPALETVRTQAVTRGFPCGAHDCS